MIHLVAPLHPPSHAHCLKTSMKPYMFLLLALLGTSPKSRAQTPVGAYFSFQTSPTASPATYSATVSASTFPGTPAFSATGSELGIFDSIVGAPNFTAFDSSVWVPGKTVSWSGAGGSTNNRWQVTLNTTDVRQLTARFNYRLNNVKSGGVLVTSLAAFEYQIDAGAFQPVPGVSLALANNTSSTNVWTASLFGLTEVENKSSVTLRWTLPDLDPVASTAVRVDNLQITGVTPAHYLPVGDYNVLFIALDDLKANFGQFSTPMLASQMPVPVTPNLDSLASSGMSFTRAYCQQAVCWASRTSLLTGLRPDTTKVWDNGPQFRTTMPGVITLPQHFANQGYSSARHGKIFDPRSTPTGQDAALSWPDGSSDYGALTGDSHNYYESGHWEAEQAAPSGSRGSLFATDAGVTNFWATPNRPVADHDYVDGRMVTAAITNLNTFAANYQNTGKRFFLGLGFKLPHLPFTSPKAYWDLYDPAKIDLTGYTGLKTIPTGSLPFTASAFEVNGYGDIPGTGSVTSVADARRLIHGYLAATSFVDAQLGRLMTALQAAGVDNNTIIVLWGDHGWQLGDHNGFWAKHSCYEQAVRAPLIIRTPGMAALGTAGKKCESPVEFVDLFPTLVDLANLPPPAQPAGLEMQGASLRPLLEDPTQPWKKGAFSQHSRNITGTGIVRPGNGMGYSMRTHRYRYTEWWRTQTTIEATGGSLDRDVKLFDTPEFRELYDEEGDPGETVNLAVDPAYASLVAELSTALAGGNGWSTAAVAPPTSYPTAFANWQYSHVEPGYPLANFADALDPDGDGISNLMEYVMGSHPLYRDQGVLTSGVTSVSGAPFLALQYPLIGVRTDATTVPKTSVNLSTWTTDGVINDNLDTNGNRTLWRSRIPVESLTNPNAFLRLETTR
jgi:iduronate 2-sulfatase